MDKIKITQEQADKIEDYKNREYGLYDFLHDLSCNHITEWQEDSAKDQEEMLKIMKAFANGYVIEPEYKVGEWVRYWKNDFATAIGKITYINYENELAQFDNTTISKKVHDVAGHATPEEITREKERRKWAAMCRNVGEFREGDLGTTHLGQWFDSVNHLEKMYRENRLAGFYPAGTFVSLLDKRELS